LPKIVGDLTVKLKNRRKAVMERRYSTAATKVTVLSWRKSPRSRRSNPSGAAGTCELISDMRGSQLESETPLRD
jgi:hypothetical protein